jgi:hypothetical protein
VQISEIKDKNCENREFFWILGYCMKNAPKDRKMRPNVEIFPNMVTLLSFHFSAEAAKIHRDPI